MHAWHRYVEYVDRVPGDRDAFDARLEVFYSQREALLGTQKVPAADMASPVLANGASIVKHTYDLRCARKWVGGRISHVAGLMTCHSSETLGLFFMQYKAVHYCLYRLS